MANRKEGNTDELANEPRYDRALLLHGRKRTEVLTLGEVQRYGTDSYSDPTTFAL